MYARSQKFEWDKKYLGNVWFYQEIPGHFGGIMLNRQGVLRVRLWCVQMAPFFSKRNLSVLESAIVFHMICLDFLQKSALNRQKQQGRFQTWPVFVDGRSGYMNVHRKLRMQWGGLRSWRFWSLPREMELRQISSIFFGVSCYIQILGSIFFQK